jgi:spore coat protein CotF
MSEVVVKYGVNETKEFILGVSLISQIMIKALKDGAQASDIAMVFAELQKPENQEIMKKAMDQVKMVPAEVKDLEMAEGFELAPMLIGEVKKWIEAAKKEYFFTTEREIKYEPQEI